MRKYLLLVLVPSAAIWAWACSNGDNTGGDGGPDGSKEGIDAAKDVGTKDGGSQDTGNGNDSSTPACDGGICCVQPSDCYPGSDPDASHPPDGGMVCCANLTLVDNDAGSCDLSSVASACSTTPNCPSNINIVTCGTNTLRGCKFDSECTEPGYDQCCSFVVDDAGTTAHVCADTLIAQAAGGSCP